MIYDDYIQYCKDYTDKYGEKTVVFMQVGDFFELYAVQNEIEKAGADIYKICDLCNIQVSRKNKSIIDNSRQNPLMAGFPIATISKFIQIMLQANYTCVLIRQVTSPPNPKREVTEIISPSMTLTTQTSEGSYLMVIYWHTNLDIGCGIIDITTGKSWIYEAYNTIQDPDFAKDEAFRLINTYQPKELVFIGELEKDIIEDIELLFCHQKNISMHCIWCNDKIKYFKELSYQNTILEKIFGKTGIITPIESLHLEQYAYARIAYCYMIQFAYEHSETIIKNIQLPIQCKNKSHLILEANAIYQLNLCSINTNETPLIDILTRTTTSFGSRTFKDRLLNPIISIEELNKRYDQIEYFKENNLYKLVSTYLSSILDLERIIRKIGLIKLQPCEWSNIQISLKMAIHIYKLLNKDFSFLEKIVDDVDNTLDIDECSKYNMIDIYTSIFKAGIYNDLDILNNQIQESLNFIQEFATKITAIGQGDSTLCKIDCNERDGYFLTTTKKRWEQVQKENLQMLKQCKVKPISASSSILRVSHPDIDKHSDNIIAHQRRLSLLNIEYYKGYLDYFYKTYQSNFNDLVMVLSEIDIACTNAKNSIDFHYVRPNLIHDKKSWVDIFGLRHPIIERLSLKTNYITNDIQLGNNKKGILLYGINASGKSSLMKSVGLNIIMAQAGMYVAADKFSLSPYHHLFTRISGMDNIYRGLSTFTVEMLELKNILNRCDDHSLILGDEICAGTEAISGISIVSAGIHELCKREASFIFATHLHELLEVNFIKENEKLNILHMHIELDPITHKIIYDRKLKPGNGSSLYGLEVCRFLKMSDNFLEIANQVRKKIQKTSLYVIEPKVSKYHKDIYVSYCEVCGKMAHETHHIKQQKDADENGYINNIHKDNQGNLIVLCEECHLKQHHGNVIITDKVQTSNGIELKMESKKTEEIDLSNHLLYQIQGWYYRLKETDKWKKLVPKNYKTIFTKLNIQVDDISLFLQENQSQYLKLNIK